MRKLILPPLCFRVHRIRMLSMESHHTEEYWRARRTLKLTLTNTMRNHWGSLSILLEVSNYTVRRINWLLERVVVLDKPQKPRPQKPFEHESESKADRDTTKTNLCCGRIGSLTKANFNLVSQRPKCDRRDGEASANHIQMEIFSQ